MSCGHGHDDGAYVLGALAPAERAAFESHLPDCASCRAAVASLAVLPGLLGRLPVAQAAAMVEPGARPRTLATVLAGAAATRARQRRRRRWQLTAAAVITAFLVAVVGVGVHTVDSRRSAGPPSVAGPSAAPGGSSPTPVALTAMQPVASSSPVSGRIGLTRVAGGTEITMYCHYESEYSGSWTLLLVVVPRTGPVEPVGSWTASSGQEISVTALTHHDPDDISKIQVLRANGNPLLEWAP
jgi:hypothetical protein